MVRYQIFMLHQRSEYQHKPADKCIQMFHIEQRAWYRLGSPRSPCSVKDLGGNDKEVLLREIRKKWSQDSKGKDASKEAVSGEAAASAETGEHWSINYTLYMSCPEPADWPSELPQLANDLPCSWRNVQSRSRTGRQHQYPEAILLLFHV